MAIAPANAGSRSGLITWSVVSTVLFVTCLVWAVISYSNASRLQKDLASKSEQYDKIILAANLSGPIVRGLEATKARELVFVDESGQQVTQSPYRNMPLLEVAWASAANLAQQVAGSNDVAKAQADLSRATRRAQAVMASKPGDGPATQPATGAPAAPVAAAAGAGGVEPTGPTAATPAAPGAATPANPATPAAGRGPTQNAVAVMEGLVRYAEQQRERADQANARAAQQQKAFAEAITAQQTEVANYQATRLQPVQTIADASAKRVEDAQRNATGTIQGVTTATSEQIDRLSQERAQLTGENAELRRQLAEATGTVQKLQGQLGRATPDQIIRHPDARIIRTEGSDRVLINLGQGDGIPAGLTFEVYDSRLGIPRADNDLPETDIQLKGKASIQVMKVNQGSSECRIIRTEPGAIITNGDIVSNLVYDRNNRFQFVVFGRFNLDNRGTPSDRDAEITNRLITQWGGKIASTISTETDFVVLGEEPMVPAYTIEERQANPLLEAEIQRAQQESDAYNEIRRQAQAMNVPILNQNRFLYLIGYYDEARR